MADSSAPTTEPVPGVSLSAVLESITDGLIVVDRSWRYRYLNAAAEGFLARSRDELLGRTIWEAFPPLADSELEREYRRALAEGASVHLEYYYDPMASWFDIRADPSAEGLTIYLQVINERKAAEQALRTRARQQAAVATLGLKVLRSPDVDSLLDEVTRAAAETLDVEYAKVLKLLPERDDLLLQAGVGWKPGSVGAAIVAGDENSQAGFTLRQREPVVVSDLRSDPRFHGPTLLTEHGVVSGMSVVIERRNRPFGILGVHTARPRAFGEDDIHFLQAMANLLAGALEREEIESALRTSEARFRELAENIREVLWMMSPRGEMLYANPAYEDVWQRPVAELYEDAASWRAAVHPEDRAAVAAALPALYHGDFDVEFRVIRPDGSQRWIHDRAFPVRDAHGRIARVVGIAEDITERRLATETALRLAEEQAARAAAQAAVYARDETLAVVSHDLRAPLQGILGSVSVLQERELSRDQQGRHLAVIERSVLGAARLIQDLLEVSSMQAGQVKLERMDVDVAGIVEQAYETFFLVARQHGIRLSSGPCSSVGAVLDEHRVLQVLSNLIDNALKHTPPDGSVTLTCVARGDVVELAVADTGPGIPAEALPHVFEWYWQASHERTAGAGIGLAVSRSIVEAHGGQIWAETEPGVGTTIRLTLPIVPAHGRPAGSAAARPAHVATTEAEHSRG